MDRKSKCPLAPLRVIAAIALAGLLGGCPEPELLTSADGGDVGPDAVCGNGEVELGEGCDDGNRDDGDGCSAACTSEICDALTCPAGCCSQVGACLDGQSDSSCGTGGADCQDCLEAELVCDAQACRDLGPCSPEDTLSCGRCGLRICGGDGTWGDCQGEGACAPGDVELGELCGTCGREERSCREDCTWGDFSCVEAGDCRPGQVRVGDACNLCGHQEQRCGDDCRWGLWACLDQGVCEPGSERGEGCGECGVQRCSDSCTWGSCETLAESCNGLDDDCDGVCDNGFECCQGLDTLCTTTCGSTGTRICGVSCAWSVTCNTPPETCNGQDDDCDGRCDESFECCRGATDPCTTSCGSTGSRRCGSSCTWESSCQLPAESCNGQDDDCDGTCDNGFTCCRDAADTCTTGCGSTGTRHCGGDCRWGGCEPPDEICDGADNDCDDQIDEGDRAEEVGTTYTVMSTFNGACTRFGERIGLNCNEAIHAFCQSRGCPQSGFGPVENSDDSLHVACVAGALVRTVSWATLAGHHADCSSAEPVSGACNAAIKRYCEAEGFPGGFGPVDATASNATLVCVSGAQQVHTTYTEMATYQPECDGTQQRMGSACNSSIKRFCRDEGYTSGFGPVENTGDDLTVICVFP